MFKPGDIVIPRKHIFDYVSYHIWMTQGNRYTVLPTLLDGHPCIMNDLGNVFSLHKHLDLLDLVGNNNMQNDLHKRYTRAMSGV